MSIRDLKNGSQPFYYKQGNIYASLNGEIYNYAELKKLISMKGYKFKTKCDTELIAPGYFFLEINSSIKLMECLLSQYLIIKKNNS